MASYQHCNKMMLDEMTFIQGPAMFPNLDRFLLQVVKVKSEAHEKRLLRKYS